jgi:hypothetical protein
MIDKKEDSVSDKLVIRVKVSTWSEFLVANA